MNCIVVGCGGISATHVNAILKNGDKIVALVDIDKNKAQILKEKFSLNSKIYDDYKEVLNEEKVDVVHICTPHYLHGQMVCYFLNHNINVLCEKPLGISKEDLNNIEQSLKNTSAQLGVCLQNRYNPSSKYLKEFLKGKEVCFASATLCWHRDEKYYASASWRGKKELEGGGVLINQALHTLDLLQWLSFMPEKVIGDVNNYSLKNIIEVEDTAMAIFSKEEKKFSIFATNSSTVDQQPIINIKTKENNIFLFPDSLWIDGKNIELPVEINKFGKPCYGNGHESLIADFYQSLKSGKKFIVDFYEGKKVIEMVLATYASKGKEIIIGE